MSRSFALTQVLAVLLLALVGFRGIDLSREPRTPVVRDRLVATDRTEPAIVVDPNHPDRLTAATNPDYDEHNPAGITDGHFFSSHGGSAWHGGEMPVLSPWTTEADPSLAVDRQGVVYFSILGEAPTYCSEGSSAVLLSQSINGGRTFGPLRVVDAGQGAHDKPWVAVESIPGKPDHVFEVWDRPLQHGSQVFVQRSTNAGKTFSKPQILEESAWLNFGAVPVVSGRQRITVVWATFPADSSTTSEPERIVARTSRDDGRTWGREVSPSGGYFKSLPLSVPPFGLRVIPSPAATATSSHHLLVAWAKLRHTWKDGDVSSEIVVTRSLNGRNWSKPVVANDSGSHDRFMPTLAPVKKGLTGIAFYDQRGGYDRFDVYAAGLSVFKGKLVVGPNTRLTSGSSPTRSLYNVPNTGCYTPGRFLGDYIGSAGDGHGRFYVAWADTQRHVANVADVWTASIRLVNLSKH